MRLRMTSLFLFNVLLFLFTPLSSFLYAAQNRPKLVLVLVIDQFRADYLTRFESQFLPRLGKSGDVGGFRYLMSQSAYFPMAHYNTLQNMTAPGHATILTGAYPYQTGIPLNMWFNRDTKQNVYATSDPNTPIIGNAGIKKKQSSQSSNGIPNDDGMSPQNLRATTVGDELKIAGYPSRVISLALKHRSAILLGGHAANLALWYDTAANEWVSSQYYLPDAQLPAWVVQTNKEIQAESGKPYEWKLLSLGTGPSDQKFAKIKDTIYTKKGSAESLATPYGLEITADLAERALDAYQLGRNGTTDLLTVSFSSHDIVGHEKGPNSLHIEEMTLAEDRVISKLLNAVRKKVPGGLKNTLIVLTADHGAAPSPEWAKLNHIPAGRINSKDISKTINTHLNEKIGKPAQGDWILESDVFNFYLNRTEILSKSLDLGNIEKEAKAAILKHPDVAYVLTSTEYENRKFLPGIFEQQSVHSYFPGRSGDLVLVPKPYFILGTSKSTQGSTTHLTGYNYDRTVPILISGFHIKNNIYPGRIEVVDIAPTLSFLCGALPPSLAEGRVLSEIIDTQGLLIK